MLLDTLDSHYENFYEAMAQPYKEWKRSTHDEAIHYRRLKRTAFWQKVLGAAAVIGALATDARNNANTRAFRDLMLIGGAAAFDPDRWAAGPFRPLSDLFLRPDTSSPGSGNNKNQNPGLPRGRLPPEPSGHPSSAT